MARAGFGGSGDYSGLFGSLYSGTRDLARQQQDADDQDALDKWSNGLMTDEEWIAYINQRITAEAGDPKRQQKWVTALRKYGPAIADSQAEQAFEQGGSINELIAHYQSRLSQLETDSNGYREVQDKLNDALDHRASQNVQTGAEKIVDRINKGKATYEDLSKFLKNAKAQARPNSSLFESLTKQIRQVDETIRTNDIEGDLQEAQYKYDTGKMSASSFAALIRQKAALFKTSDPKRYYQMLGAASDLSRGGSGGGGGGGGGGGSRARSSGGTAKVDLNKQVDALQAQRNALQAIVQQYDENPSAPVFDPRDGTSKVLSTGDVKKVDRDLVSTFDRLAATYTAKGDDSAASNTQKSKAYYVSTTVVQHNTMPAIEQSQHLLGSVNSMLDAALGDPDPTHGLNRIKQAAAVVAGWAGRYATQQTYLGDGKTAVTPRGAMDAVDGQFLNRVRTLGDALTTLSNENATDDEARAALDTIRALDGAATGGTSEGAITTMAKKALEVNGTRQGLLNGDLERIITSDGIKYVPKVLAAVNVIVNGSQQTVFQKVADTSEYISDPKRQQEVDVFIDINGQPTKVKTIASVTSPSGAMAWYAKSQIKLKNGTIIPAGQAIPSDIVAKHGDEIGSKGELRPAFTYYQAVIPSYTDSRGTHQPEIWSQDPQTQLWYKGGLPIRNVQYNPDGTVTIDGEGQPTIDFQSYAHAKGVPSPYAGNNTKAMQDIANQGLAGKPAGGRDITGKYDQNLEYDPMLAYHSPFKQPTTPGQRDSWWDDDERQKKADAEVEAFKSKVRAQDQKDREEREAFIRKTLNPEAYAKRQAERFLEDSPFAGVLKAFGIVTGTKAPAKPKSLVTGGNRNIDFDPSTAIKVKGASSGPDLSTDIDIKTVKSGPTSIKTGTTKPKADPKKKVSSAPKVTVKKTVTPKPQNTTTTSTSLEKLRQSTGGGR